MKSTDFQNLPFAPQAPFAKENCNVIGAEKMELTAIEKKQKAKFVTQEYLRHLIDIDSPMHNSYVNSQNCATTIFVNDGKATTQYCKQRWCQVCNRIKTAKLINGYMPQFRTFTEPYFVTLTNKNCPPNELAEMLQVYQTVWRTIYKRMKKNKFDLKGLKKIECTYNSEFDTYHPHFHFVIESEMVSNCLIENWLLEMKAGDLFQYGAEPIAQHMTPANEKSMLELFKYFTKLMAKPNSKGERLIYVSALDNIFNCMKNRRVFESFGIKKVKEDFEKLTAQEMEDHITGSYRFQWNFDQWYYGNAPLTNMQISPSIRSIGKNIVL